MICANVRVGGKSGTIHLERLFIINGDYKKSNGLIFTIIGWWFTSLFKHRIKGNFA